MSTTTSTPSNPDNVSLIDPALRKKVLRMIPYGMFVITSKLESELAAATIDWVTQSSFEPPMVVCCLRNDSFIYQVILKSRKYAIHPLAEGQKAFAQNFFKNKNSGPNH